MWSGWGHERLGTRDRGEMRSDHLLVIGAQRCGTTYLHTLLDAHPQITMARPARPEPKVFCSDELADKGADWYRATYFAHAAGESLLGEKSTSYLEDSRAPARAVRTLGAAHIVVMLRDPVQRAVSNWRFSTDNGFETRPLEVALRENLTAPASWDRSASSVSPFAYLERGRYADQLAPWLDTFPETSHLWFIDDLRSGEDAVRAAFDQLGVDPWLHAGTSERIVNASREPAPSLPAELVGALRAYFADADDALGNLAGRTLPWQADAGGSNG